MHHGISFHTRLEPRRSFSLFFPVLRHKADTDAQTGAHAVCSLSDHLRWSCTESQLLQLVIYVCVKQHYTLVPSRFSTTQVKILHSPLSRVIKSPLHYGAEDHLKVPDCCSPEPHCNSLHSLSLQTETSSPPRPPLVKTANILLRSCSLKDYWEAILVYISILMVQLSWIMSHYGPVYVREISRFYNLDSGCLHLYIFRSRFYHNTCFDDHVNVRTNL